MLNLLQKTCVLFSLQTPAEFLRYLNRERSPRKRRRCLTRDQLSPQTVQWAGGGEKEIFHDWRRRWLHDHDSQESLRFQPRGPKPSVRVLVQVGQNEDSRAAVRNEGAGLVTAASANSELGGALRHNNDWRLFVTRPKEAKIRYPGRQRSLKQVQEQSSRQSAAVMEKVTFCKRRNKS